MIYLSCFVLAGAVLTLLVIAFIKSEEEIGLLFFLCFCVFTLIFLIDLLMSIGAVNSANFYNKTYGTNYTAKEVYWNDKMIRENLQGKKIIIDGLEGGR
jgi:hypothetical protein